MLDYDDIDPYIAKCVRCGTCKAVFGLFEPSCPAGERFRFEGFFSSGKIWIAVEAYELGAENSNSRLRAVIEQTLADFEVTGTVF